MSLEQNEVLRARLYTLAEPSYQAFSIKLLPTVKPDTLLGVRLPVLRKIAVELAAKNWTTYLQTAWDELFEERMLQGMVLGAVREPAKTVLPWVKTFVPKIDNWSICDSFCSGLRLAKREPEAVWSFLQPYLTDSRAFFARFGLVMLRAYYLKKPYLEHVLVAFEQVQSNDYYAKMALAWAIADCYIRFPEQTTLFLRTCQLDSFSYRKAIQKICESKQVGAEEKQKLRTLLPACTGAISQTAN